MSGVAHAQGPGSGSEKPADEAVESASAPATPGAESEPQTGTAPEPESDAGGSDAEVAATADVETEDAESAESAVSRVWASLSNERAFDATATPEIMTFRRSSGDTPSEVS